MLIKANGPIESYPHLPSNEFMWLNPLVRMGLVHKINSNSYDLTAEGMRAAEMGGVENWKKNKESEEAREDKIKDHTALQMRFRTFQVKHWLLVIVISAIVLAIVSELIKFIICKLAE